MSLYAIAKLKELGVERLFVEAHGLNDAAMKLHNSVGFKEVDTEVLWKKQF